VTYRNDEVAALLSNVVSVKVNAEVDTLLRRQYGVAGFPTIVLTKSDASEIDRIFGYADPPNFVKTINDYLADRNTLGDYLRRADTAASMQLYSMIADKYTGRSDFAKAEEFYQKILTADPTNAQGYSDSALYMLADMKTRAKAYAEAEAIYVSFPTRFPNSGLVKDAAFDIGHARRRAEKYDDAVTAYKDFIKAYPGSEEAETAEIYIAMCYEKKGDTAQAVELYRKFLVDHPKSEDTTYVKKQIDKITNPPKKEGQ
jgi:TolA-binding protein